LKEPVKWERHCRRQQPALKGIIGLLLFAVLFAVLLAGCAATYEGRYSYDLGWRLGRVIAVENLANIAKRPSEECRPAPAEGQEMVTYVVISYQTALRRYRHRMAPLPANTSLRVGDAVYVNTNDCAADFPPVTRLF